MIMVIQFPSDLFRGGSFGSEDDGLASFCFSCPSSPWSVAQGVAGPHPVVEMGQTGIEWLSDRGHSLAARVGQACGKLRIGCSCTHEWESKLPWKPEELMATRGQERGNEVVPKNCNSSRSCKVERIRTRSRLLLVALRGELQPT